MWLLLACTPDDGRHPIHPGERPPLDSGDADTDADSGTDSPSWFAAYWANDVNAVATPSQTAAELGFAPWGNAGPSGDLRNANAIVAGMSDAGWQLPSDAPYSGSGSTTHGSTDQFLAAVDFRLEEAIRRFSAARVLILGDLVHGRVAPSVVDDVAAWRAGVSVAMTLVRGNHDRHTPELPEEWRISSVFGVLEEGPFAFRHEPEGVPGRYTWAGHVHPMVTLASGSDALRLPCFHVGANLGILPAFGTFTAGVSLRRQPGDEVFAVAEGQVVAIRGGGRRGACA